MGGLLETPPWAVLEDYFARVTADAGLGATLRVGMTEERGKGVFARRRVREGEVVFKERMLAGMQHRRNKGNALVCSQCLRFVGSVELQLARRLPLEGLENLEESSEGNPSHRAGTAEGVEGEEEEEEEEEDEEEEEEGHEGRDERGERRRGGAGEKGGERK